MKADHYYTELLKLMRKQGAKDNPVTLQLGVVLSDGTVKVGDLVLEKDDFYLAEGLVLKDGDLIAIQRLNDTDMYVVLVKVVVGA